VVIAFKMCIGLQLQEIYTHMRRPSVRRYVYGTRDLWSRAQPTFAKERYCLNPLCCKVLCVQESAIEVNDSTKIQRQSKLKLFISFAQWSIKSSWAFTERAVNRLVFIVCGAKATNRSHGVVYVARRYIGLYIASASAVSILIPEPF